MESKKYWIAVVDDDEISLKNARDLLAGDELRITSLRSGQELLKFVRKNRPDLILLDVMMPEMDGFETYQKFCEYEASEGNSPIPVIFLTGENDSEVEQKGLMIGASDFIRKPINREVLLRRVHNIITNKKAIDNLTEEAQTDKLTGFYNKACALQKMVQVCRENTGILMVLDLDSFKLINDIYGHEMGDNVLISFADIARRNCRSDDLLFRIGGDEFMAFFPDTLDESAAIAFTERLNKQLTERCISLMGDEFDIPIGVSTGCVPVTEKGDYDELFRLADKALYHIKQHGKHGCGFYDAEAGQEAETEFNPEQERRKMITLCSERGKAENAMILGQDSFIPVYQYMDRLAKQRGERVIRILLYLSAVDNTDKNGYRDAASCLGDILKSNLPASAVLTQCRYNSFFLLMPEVPGSDDKAVLNIIFSQWEQSEYAKTFRLCVNGDGSD